MNTKQKAGREGGRATFAKHGAEHMRTIGRLGGRATWKLYRLAPVGASGWAMVHRNDGTPKAFIGFFPGR